MPENLEGSNYIINQYAFYECYNLTSITIPDSVTSIGNAAFYDCSSLRSVTIGTGVTSIGSSAFLYCSKNLESITVSSENTKYSGAGNCLIDTSTKTLMLGCKNSIIPTDGSVTSIGSSAFCYCSSLTSITIPDSVTSIGSDAFEYCSSLTSITIPDSVTSIGGSAFYNCTNITNIIIPDSVTSIGSSAFQDCYSLTSATIGSGVTSIGSSAFYSCRNLTSVTIGRRVTSIGGMAFYNCLKLVEVYNLSSKNITIGSSSNGDVGNYAKVIHRSLSEESIVKEIDDYQYMIYNGVYYLLGYKGTATELILPENLEGSNYAIYNYAFYECSSLISITIPDSVTSIGASAFYKCSNLTNLTIGNGVTTIGEDAFTFSNINYNILDNVEYLGNNENPYLVAMDVTDRTLTSYTISNNTRFIYKYAFYNCNNFTKITIPDSVTSIGRDAFSNCYKLVEVYNLSSLSITAGSSSNGYAGYYAKVIHTSLSEESIVKEIGDYQYIIDNGEYYLLGYKGTATELTLPENLEGNNYSINQYAFCGCSNLTSITIPDSVTSIGNAAFSDCEDLISVTIGNGVTTIGEDAFNNCNNLTSVTIGNGVTSIGNYAFYECSSLISITIPSSVTSIGESAFEDCSGLKIITIGSGVTNIGYEAFYYCDDLIYVYYDGTENEWRAISIGEENESLTNAKIHYLYGWTLVEVQTEPTCTESGVAIYEKNGVQKQVAIPKLGHDCDENGVCARCGVEFTYIVGKTSGAGYEFVESDGIYTSNNKGINSSTASTTLTAMKAIKITITWTVSSESGYDELTIMVNGTAQVDAVSGEENGSFTVSLSAGDTVEFIYTKDSSDYDNNDCATFTISY